MCVYALQKCIFQGCGALWRDQWVCQPRAEILLYFSFGTLELPLTKEYCIASCAYGASCSHRPIRLASSWATPLQTKQTDFHNAPQISLFTLKDVEGSAWKRPKRVTIGQSTARSGRSEEKADPDASMRRRPRRRSSKSSKYLMHPHSRNKCLPILTSCQCGVACISGK